MLRFPEKLANIWRLVPSREGIRDTFVLMIPEATTVATALVTSVLIARGLGPDGLGRYALVQSVAAIAGSLSNLGLGRAALRYAARAYAEGDIEGQLAVLRWAFRIRLAMVLLITLGFYLFSPVLAGTIWHLDDLTYALRLGLLGGVFAALSAVPMLYFQSRREFVKNTIVAVAQNLLNFAGIIGLAIFHWWSVNVVLAVTLVGSGAGALAFLLMIPRRALWPVWPGFPSGLHQLWRAPRLSCTAIETDPHTSPNTFAFYNLIATLITICTLRLDVWLMGVFLRPSEIGVYNVAFRFIIPLQIVGTSLNDALWPRAAARGSLETTRSLLRTAGRASLLVAAGGALYGVAAPMLAPMLFGPAYENAVFLGQLLCLGQCVNILFSPVMVVGYNLGLVRRYWMVNLAQLFAEMIVLVPLLPSLGATAAALAFAANAVTGCVMNGMLIRRRLRSVNTPVPCPA